MPYDPELSQPSPPAPLPKGEGRLSGFTVGTLLLLTAVVAIGMAGIRTLVVVDSTRIDEDVAAQSGTTPRAERLASAVVQWRQRQEEAGMRALAGAMIGLLVGIGIGVTRPRPVLGVLLGILVGWFVGGVAGGVLAQPENLPLAAIGSAVLLLLGGVIHLLSSRPTGGC